LLSNDTDPNAGDILNMAGFDAVTAHGNAVTQRCQRQTLCSTSAASINRWLQVSPATDRLSYTIADSAGATSSATGECGHLLDNDGSCCDDRYLLLNNQ